MIGSKQLKVGMIIKHEGELWRVMSTMHTQPGKGGAYIQTKLRNVLKGTQTEYRFRSGEPVERVVLDQRDAQFLYAEGETYHFMDNTSYEQIQMQKDNLENALPYLKDGGSVMIELYEGSPIGIEMPKSVRLKIIETEPYIKTATATNSLKGAKLETGYSVKVPGFIEEGEEIEIDTSTGEYLSRAK
ncbi:MAG TPA: elongation factor P [Oligoflexia bacterium]|nr:elongation factor P [Oligoflexia bacterium]HMR24853.1 elongation factor P [Oligoflexia bacterium]